MRIGRVQEPTRASGPCNGYDARDEIRGASQSQGNVPAEAQRLDNGGEEVLEVAGGHVEMLHEDQHPEPRIAAGLQKTGKSARVFL